MKNIKKKTGDQEEANKPIRNERKDWKKRQKPRKYNEMIKGEETKNNNNNNNSQLEEEQYKCL